MFSMPAADDMSEELQIGLDPAIYDKTIPGLKCDPAYFFALKLCHIPISVMVNSQKTFAYMNEK